MQSNNKYAKTLFNLSKKSNCVSLIQNHLKLVSYLYNKVPTFRLVFITRRINSENKVAIMQKALKNFEPLLKYNPYFISYELFHLYGLDYCKSISKLFKFPIDTKKVKELLKPKYNTNKKYITKIKKGLFDKHVYKASYIDS